jgi:hypothetical protein
LFNWVASSSKQIFYIGEYMPILITLLSIIGAAYFWSGRARNARDAAEDIVHVASDVRLAFRRMGFKRKTNIHPVDAIEDNDQLTAIIAKAFVEKKGVVALDDIMRLREALQNEFDCSNQKAEDLTIVADWAIRECGTVDVALSRASRRHYKTHEINGFQSLMRVIGQITCETDLGPKQKEALDDIALIFHIRK